MIPIEDEHREISVFGPPQKYSLSDLGFLSYPGSSASAINNQGDVIGTLGVGARDEFSPQANHSFLWKNGKVVDFGRSLAVTSINDNGQMVGIEYPADFDSSTMTLEVKPIFYRDPEWQHILPTGATSGVPVALNTAGQVVGHLCSGQSREKKKSFRPALWSSGIAHLLKIPSFYNSGVVKGLNDAGQAVGFLQKVSSEPSYRTSAVLWDKDVVTLLGTLPGADQSEAIAINTKGQILCVATYGYAEFENYMRQLMEGKSQSEARSLVFGGFIYDGGKTTALITSDNSAIGIDVAKGCMPRAINDNSVVVGRAADLQGETIAFVWQNHRMVDLNTLVPSRSGWTLAEAKGINNKGQIVGQGKYDGRTHAFLLTPHE